MARVLLLLPTATYRASDFLAASRALDAEVVVASERRQAMSGTMGDRALVVDLRRPEAAAEAIVTRAQDKPLDAVVGTDEQGVLVAALAAARLGLAHNPPEAVAATRDKSAMRGAFAAAGLRQPDYRVAGPDADVAQLAGEVGLPCVVKAVSLSASRGVIRADDSEELMRAVKWVRAIQTRADRDAQELGLIIEDFIPGREYALEGSLQRGELTTLALFDKPDPLDGPYFEETLYITPSRLPQALQDRIHREVARACRAAELMTGPVHAEVRVNDQGIWILEVAARSIGGLCGRVLIHFLGMSLEELILRQVVAESLPIPLPAAIDAAGEGGAAGVMMIPIPRRGIYHGLDGLAAAQSVRGVTGVAITVEPGQIIAPPPDGASYLGFIFARAASPADAEMALRISHRRLHFDIRPEYPATVAPAAERP